MPSTIGVFRTEEKREIRRLINEFRFELKCERVSVCVYYDCW